MIYVFQHVGHEFLGNLEAPLLDSGFKIQNIPLYAQGFCPDALAKLENPEALIFMGGSMSANEEAKYPWMAEEFRLMEDALKSNLPMLGICLGSQMLAKVLGSRVYPGPQKEIGWYDLQLSFEAKQDRLFEAWPENPTLFHWHGETFDLPQGAERLASSELYPNQAYRYGENIYGLQFHPEMTAAMIQEWLKLGASELQGAGLAQQAQNILNENPQYLPALKSYAERLALGWASRFRSA